MEERKIRICIHAGQTFTVSNPNKIKWWETLLLGNKLPYVLWWKEMKKCNVCNKYFVDLNKHNKENLQHLLDV